MADSHDRAARKIARKVNGRYDPKKSPDVRGPIRVEVKSTADEVSDALQQLGGGAGAAYIALPAKEIPKAKKRLKGLLTGLMDHNGNINKPSTRKRK